MSTEELSIIARKYLNGTASSEEKKRLLDWYNSFDAELELTIDAAETEDEAALEQKMLNRLQEHIQAGKPSKVIPIYRRLAVAAAAVLIIATGTWYLITQTSKPKTQNVAYGYKNDVAPGKMGAVLQLPDGRKIVVDTAANGLLATEGNADINKEQNGLAVASNGATTKMEYATLTTPIGRTQMITLSDGTKVWLNAGSSITFPVNFIGNERKIITTGQVALKVVHNEKMPFRVETKGKIFEDIGTDFDINAYDDEPVVKTTVLEGSVKINSTLIKAGMQAQVDTHGQIKLIEGVATDEVFAWRDGQFDFADATVESILKQAARWYDVQVVYERKINTQFTLDVDRNTPISKLLHAMEASGGVHFEIEGRKIIVRP